MMDPQNAVLAACSDLANEMSGLEVVEDGNIHLHITDPILAMCLQPLMEEGVNSTPRPPRVFNPIVEIADSHHKAPMPWASSGNRHLEKYYLSNSAPFVVSFVDGYGAQQRSDALAEMGIPPERQFIYVLDGHVREPLVHKLTTYFLASRGWFVASENQYPITVPDTIGYPHTEVQGQPDIVAWKSPFTTSLREAGLVTAGATLNELAFLSSRENTYQSPPANQIDDIASKSLVAEVKGTNKSPGAFSSQLSKYSRSKFYDYAYGVLPGYRDRTDHWGFITFDEFGYQHVSDPIATSGTPRNSRASDSDKDWFTDLMDRVACQALLCNLEFDELVDLGQQAADAKIRDPYALVHALWNLSPSTVRAHILTKL